MSKTARAADRRPDFDRAVRERLGELSELEKENCPSMDRAADASARLLQAAIPALEGLADWTQEAVHDCLIGLAESLGVKNATLMWPVRIAAAGKQVTPGGAVEICQILGREETLRRLRTGLEKLA